MPTQEPVRRDYVVVAVKIDCLHTKDTLVETFGQFTHEEGDAFALALSDRIKAEWMFYSQQITPTNITDPSTSDLMDNYAQYLLNLLESQIAQLMKELDDVEKDVIADQGEEAWEAGGWEIIKDQIRYSSYPDEVKRQCARMHGIDRDLIGLADPDNERYW